MERVLTRYGKSGIIKLPNNRKGVNMNNAKKISISLNEEIIEKGKMLATERGIPHFSTLLSVLIAEEYQRRKEKRK